MSTHSDLRRAETAVIEGAMAFMASASRPLATNLRRMSVDADHYGELAEACLALQIRRRNLDGDAAHNRTDTSVLASKLPGKSTLRRAVLNALLVRYAYTGDGMTTDALELSLHRAHTSVSSAMNYLVNHGLVGDTGTRRDTSSGSPAIVYAPTELGRTLAHEAIIEEEVP